MGLLDWLPWRREQRMLTLEQWSSLGLLDPPTAAGVSVSERSALTVPAYLGGVKLIASAIAKAPRKVYQKMPDGSRKEADKHPVAWLLEEEPNELSIPFVFWQTLMGHVLTWGNGYAEIERDGASRPIALITIPPDQIEPVLEGGVLSYVYRGKVRLARQDVLHVSGFGFDGVKGYSVVQYARQTIGLSLAAERFGAAFFGNGAMPGMLLEHPGKLGKDAADRVKESWNAMHQGPDRAHRTAILEEGMKAHVLTIPAKDAQLIEARQIGVLDIARILNVNPTFLGVDVAARPGGNYEAGRLDYLDNTLDPWMVSIEQECNRKLLSKQQRGTYYVEHVRNAILRTDATTRANVQKLYVDMGAMTPEYVAKLENLPKPPEEPLPAPAPAEEDPPEDDPPPDAAGQAQRALVLDIAARFGRREAEKARRASRRGAADFQRWAEEFYAREVDVLAEMLRPAVALRFALAGVDGGDAVAASRGLAESYVVQSKHELLGLRAAELETQAETLLQRWALHRPVEMADAVAALKVEENHAA